MKNRILIVVLSIVAMLTTVECKKDKNEEIDCSNIVVSYTDDISPLLTSSCNTSGCHRDGFSAGDFTTYNGTKPKATNGTMRSKVIDGSMPPSGSLSDTQIQEIVCWIDSGSANN